MKQSTLKRVFDTLLATNLCVALSFGVGSVVNSYLEWSRSIYANELISLSETGFARIEVDTASMDALIFAPRVEPTVTTAGTDGAGEDGLVEGFERRGDGQYNTRTITIYGETIPYIDSYYSAKAPDGVAGIWMGSDSTQDNDLGYFIGHNPGVFHNVVNLTYGDTITVTDTNGLTKTYTVFDVFDVPRDSYLTDIYERVYNHGESVAVQACLPYAYRICIAN